MARESVDCSKLARQLVADARNRMFKPIYLLMGEEPYYVDMVCNAVIENALDESERDFNQIVCYGADVNADAVITAARRYPMFADRQLVVVKEAQMMSDLEQLSLYCSNPLESTILVICIMGRTADKRKALYKSIQKNGVVLESTPLQDYQTASWITGYFKEQGLDIAPDAAGLLAEHTGPDLGKISVETAKMLKNLPEGTASISVDDIERNVGISRQYSIFQLTKCLSSKDCVKAMKIAANISASPKFAMPMATAALFSHFYKILKYNGLLMNNPRADNATRASVLGVSPYFLREYDEAVRNYPLAKCMGVIALLKEYDFKGKGGDAGEATAADLFTELIVKILA